MPNWTNNLITATFKSEKDKKAFIKRHIIKGDFDFGTIILEPISPKGLDDRYLSHEGDHIERLKDKPWFNWYRWHNDFWGTKWNACETYTDDSKDKELTISFQTAWATPIPILAGLVKRYAGKGVGFDWSWIDEEESIDYDEGDYPHLISVSSSGKVSKIGC